METRKRKPKFKKGQRVFLKGEPKSSYGIVVSEDPATIGDKKTTKLPGGYYICMWEVWCWDGRYIKGKLVKKYKTKQSALNYVKKSIKHDQIVQDKKIKDCFWVENKHDTVAVIEKKKPKK